LKRFLSSHISRCLGASDTGLVFLWRADVLPSISIGHVSGIGGIVWPHDEVHALTDHDTALPHGTQTILFTDLVGSTDMRVRLGDTAADEVFKDHDRLVRSQIEEGGGTIVKGTGDGFMALFSSASRAIETAVSTQRAIQAHNEANPHRHMSVRMGLNSGDVTHFAGDTHGTAVHAAARIADKAQGDQILISQIVSDLAGSHGSVKLADRGLFWLKSFPDRWRLYEVMWRDRDPAVGRVGREERATSAAAFDPTSPRAATPIVGRRKEQQVVTDQIALVGGGSGLRAVVLEGEAGIGKTRLLEAAIDVGVNAGTPFFPLQVSADEELRGPFLLFRSLLSSPRVAAMAREVMALEPLDRARDAISGGAGGQGSGLSPQEQMLRIFDEVASAIAAISRERPVALLFDDLQWADEDSIQLIRYLVRTLPTAPIFLLITIRPYAGSSTGAGKLIADLDRMRVTQVLRLDRLSRPETAELIQTILGSPVDDQTLHSLHARSEGVPFFIEELVRAYREADALQLMDGTWTMTRLSGSAVPSSVQSLIERRLAQLSDECRGLLADAGALGRRFRLADLAPVLAKIRHEEERPAWELAEDLDMAVRYGLLVEEADSADYDFSFSHDQIRASLLDGLPRRRQQAIHAAIAEMLEARGGEAELPMLAYHWMKAGDMSKAVANTLAAARSALAVSAPEESIRLIDGALPAASEPADRIEMLRVKDDALSLLDRGMDRIANLAEMTALTGAVVSPQLDAEVKLRRASASRAIEDYDKAAELAAAVREAAALNGDLDLEMKACFELGQAYTRCAIGEGYWPLSELELDPPEEAYTRALEIARQVGSRSDEAIALRELAVIEAGRVRQAASAAEAAGTSIFEIIAMAPTLFAGAKELGEQAFRIFEEIGDQRGAMSALISMAYSHVADPTAHGMAGRIEHVRALQNSRQGQITDSQRAVQNALMLYSIHAYARLNIQPDLALERGQEAFAAARGLGDRWLEALSAGGMSLTHASIGASDESNAWLERAAAAAMAVPSPSMARRLEMWRGASAASGGRVDEMSGHFLKAAGLAGTKNAAGAAEAHCALAVGLAKVWAETGDEDLLERAEEAAQTTLQATASLPEGHPWAGMGHAVLALAAQSRGRSEEAAAEARVALTSFDALTHVPHLVDVLWVAGRVLVAQEEPEAEALREQIAQGLGYLSMSMTNPETKTKWFSVHSHRELAEVVGFDLSAGFGGEHDTAGLEDADLELLRHITSGSGDGPVGEEAIASLLAKLGVASETEAIEYAIKAGITWQ
jgi:class 3 adenylate cyclase/tetratricopeptide (TPR) repeat protein